MQSEYVLYYIMSLEYLVNLPEEVRYIELCMIFQI